MKVLAIDTAGRVAAAALFSNGKIVAEYVLNHKLTHSEKIMPMIERILAESETDISEIELFAAAKGPGSFTGLRIGAATVNGLAHALHKPAMGISTLEALAYNLPECAHTVVPMMDARRSHVYTAAYSTKGGISCLVPEHDASIEEVAEFCHELGTPVIFTGDGIYLHREYLKERLGDKSCFAPAQAANQSAASIAVLAAERYSGEAGYVLPMYLKKSQAERELEERKNDRNRL